MQIRDVPISGARRTFSRCPTPPKEDMAGFKERRNDVNI